MTEQTRGQGSADRQYAADRPIESGSEDRLGRRGLAEHLAHSITAIPHPASVVIGIQGPWGSGKSSLLNLVDHELSLPIHERSAPLVVRFNPWNFASQDQLTYMFFREIARAVKTTDQRKLAGEIASRVEATGVLLAPLKLVPGAGIIPEFLTSSAKVVKALVKDNSLQDLKASINKKLVQLDRRIVVLLDDLDRLDAEAIRLVFRLVRLNADFRNVVYLLAFDREVVERALMQEQGTSGRAYLEKIVQVSVDLPSIDPAALSDMLHEEVNKVIGVVPEERWNKDRWQSLYFRGFRSLFKTLRDIKRYTNGLQFTLPTVLGEVDAVDFLGIDAIRCFSSDTYNLMRSMKTLLTEGSLEPVLIPSQASRASAEESRKVLIDSAPEQMRESIRGILESLFPQLETLRGGPTYAGDQDLWRKERRACDPESFDRYFLLAVPRGDLPEAEWQQIVGSADSAEALREALEALNKRSLLLKFVERTIIDPKAVRNVSLVMWVEQLADLYVDEADRMESGFWGSLLPGDPYNPIHSLIYLLLERLPDGAPRMAPIVTVMAKGANLAEAALLVSRLSSAKWGRLIFSADEIRDLQKGLVDRIEGEMDAQAFEHFSPDELQSLLWRWREFAGEGRPTEWVKELVATDAGLLAFLTAAVSQRTIHSELAVRREWGLSDETVSTFLAGQDLDGLKVRAERLRNTRGDSLSERQTRAIELFRGFAAQSPARATAETEDLLGNG